MTMVASRALSDSQESSFVHFDGMTWPNPMDPTEIEWRLRYGHPTREDILMAATFMAAYKELVFNTQERRNAKVRGIRKAMTDGR